DPFSTAPHRSADHRSPRHAGGRRRGGAAHGAARRDAVGHRRPEQPDDADAGRLQRPARGRQRHPRLDDPHPVRGRGRGRPGNRGHHPRCRQHRSGSPGRRHPGPGGGSGAGRRVCARADGLLHRPPGRHAVQAGRRRRRVGGRHRRDERTRPRSLSAVGHRAQAAVGLPHAAGRRGEARPHRHGRAAGGAEPDSRARHRQRHRPGRLRPRRARLAGLGDRLAGERLQQLDGLQRQRARRHAGHAGHLELGAGQPHRSAPESRLAERQRARGGALPAPAPRRDRRRRGHRHRGLLPGPRVGARARALRRHQALRAERPGAAQPLRRL
ncbi:MAG: GH23 / CBM50, partial [uncultured Solirubrobacteraceae bacterium]